jgi:5'(3')-deoxyribonucleotidase
VGNALTAVAPNPFFNRLGVTVQAAKTGEAQLTLIDIYGREIVTQKTGLLKGKNNLTLEVFPNIPPGNYFLRVKAEELLEVHKLIKQ